MTVDIDNDIADKLLLSILVKKKAESIKVLEEMWLRYKSMKSEPPTQMFEDLMAMEDYDDALSTIIQFHAKNA